MLLWTPRHQRQESRTPIRTTRGLAAVDDTNDRKAEQLFGPYRASPLWAMSKTGETDPKDTDPSASCLLPGGRIVPSARIIEPSAMMRVPFGSRIVPSARTLTPGRPEQLYQIKHTIYHTCCRVFTTERQGEQMTQISCVYHTLAPGGRIVPSGRITVPSGNIRTPPGRVPADAMTLSRSPRFILSRSFRSPEKWPANTMWRKLLYSGFETCFGPSTQGAGTKTHLKSRFCAILKKRGAM